MQVPLAPGMPAPWRHCPRSLSHCSCVSAAPRESVTGTNVLVDAVGEDGLLITLPLLPVSPLGVVLVAGVDELP